LEANKLKVLDKLIFNNSKIRISFKKDFNQNTTKDSILIEGNRNGFLSMANLLLYFNNELTEDILLHDIPFVDSHFPFIVNIKDEEGTKLFDAEVVNHNNSYYWMMDEINFCQTCSSFHSLGTINAEIHFDDGIVNKDAISVYAVVSDDI